MLKDFCFVLSELYVFINKYFLTFLLFKKKPFHCFLPINSNEQCRNYTATLIIYAGFTVVC